MLKTFRAQKMIDRVRREGKGDMLDEKTLAFIRSLDGKQGNDYNWQSAVYNNNMVWIPSDGKGNGTYVNAEDCD